MTDALLNLVRREAERVAGRTATVRMGTVSAYDPARYCAKVRLQPEDCETGWLPVASPWVGNGWGLFAPVSPGDAVDVHFQEGHREAGYVSQRFYSDAARPLPAPPGEFWLVHQSGSTLRFLNDGTVTITASQINSTAPLWRHTGDMRVTGEIYDLDATRGSLGALRDAYVSHVHVNTASGPGTSGVTNLPI